MDQKRLMLAIALSIAILLGFQAFMPKHPAPPVPVEQVAQTNSGTATPATPAIAAPTASGLIDQGAADRNAPRVKFTAARVEGSINLRGAKFDDLVLRDYRDTVEPGSSQVRLLESRSDAQPYYVQFGWTADPGSNLVLPDDNTEWKADGALTSTTPLTLTWNNGSGLEFRITVSVDANFMFTINQSVVNSTGAQISVYPYSRIRRYNIPVTAAYYVLHEGLIGVLNGSLYDSNFLGAGNGDFTFAGVKSRALKNDGLALDKKSVDGWAGITDKYWLTALIPDAAVHQDVNFRYIDQSNGVYQVDFLASTPEKIATSETGSQSTRMFSGAKEVHLLDHYADNDHVKDFDKAVDFGIFYFITKPFFYAIDYLNGVLGNFGLAIMVFTLCLKILFLPLANKSYRSMSKMKLLAPKIQALKELYKDDQTKVQQGMMALYKAEKVNPASGCLPMLIQIPIFFSLYKVIFVTIEMRQAPFFGWIHDLSAIDPTNVFNLFGLIPFDPSIYSHYLHLGAWPLIMGCTMFFQQKLNPPPPDPMQAKMFQFMPIIFTFMLANFPAGLVIYWSWNNSLTILQQTLIMRGVRLSQSKNAIGAAKS